eukprot:3981818-Amphidinium_carterae.1
MQGAVDNLIAALSQWGVARNHNRGNLATQQGGAVRCMILGAYTVQGSGVTRATHQAVQSGLWGLIWQLLTMRRRALPFSSVAVTMNAASPVHRDKNNSGLSSVLSFGPFRGGELLTEDPAGRKRIHLPNGEWRAARVVHSKMDWSWFDATKWHTVLPFSGTRFSIAAYCCRGLHRLGSEETELLRGLGFQLPSSYPSEGDDIVPDEVRADLKSDVYMPHNEFLLGELGDDLTSDVYMPEPALDVHASRELTEPADREPGYHQAPDPPPVFVTGADALYWD